MNQSLQEVQQLFIEWRQQKKYPREKIPKKLWKEAAQLIPKYSITRVTRTLKISAVSLKQKIKKYHSSINQSSKEVGFADRRPVEVNRTLSGNRLLSVPPLQSTLHCDRIEIQRKDGSRLTLYSQEDHVLDGKTLIRVFLGEDHASNGRRSACSTD